MPKKPNLLLIMADQLRADWIGCSGTSYVDTPHIDSIAGRGMRFTRACCNSPLCAPSRAAIASGRYPHRTGVLNNFNNMSIDQPTYYQALRRAGYRVGLVGKSDLHKGDHHLGDRGDLPIMYHLGFTDVLETEGKMNAAWPRQSQGQQEEGEFVPAGPYQRYLIGEGKFTSFVEDFAHRAKRAPVWYAKESVLEADDFHDSYIGRKSCEFLEQVGDESPWHLFVSFVGPHDPWDAPDDYLEPYKTREYPPSPCQSMEGKPDFVRKKSRRQSAGMTADDLTGVKRHYAGAIQLIDDWIGRMLHILEQKNMADNTIIVFCSDHGEMLGDFGLFQKEVMYEGALRIPFIVADPRSEACGENDALVELVDLCPSLLEWAGIQYDKDEFNGKSLVPLLGRSGEEHKRYQISELFNTQMICDGRYKYIENYNDVFELYDLQADPNEQVNILEAEPDVVRRLRSALRAQLK